MRPALQHDSLDSLAAAAAKGNDEAMARLSAAVRPMVVRRCRAELTPGVADMVADVAWTSVLRTLGGHTMPDEPFLRLVCATTTRLIARIPTSDRRDPASTGLAGLPTPERDVLTLRLILGLDIEDTATSLGRTPGEVLLDQHRALQTLRRTLAGVGSGDVSRDDDRLRG
ncbi:MULTISPECIES: RNA polymerase subunit sigma [unclassified Rhodococcus (in: high G+C Gram-positive bacteria)]|uniref:RNA polymerase subunit sigma n=1 Tax=unclassified Rhodococcus (in: high G+C Gram-positive bacteria) TaxID=192944 RepID=UPI00163AC85F|nr:MULTISPECIES: RNA polymerase subunit sigma [unclassified Rhodococcus (in: high G+C Gram-positive bacteria)]MBC2638268.1 RNA polymerase subunit sigma [Rhodococcus sp. 3A]MBC2896991.1 RNA polymerase subunit sigma [Rhodococcus sp. 4CII]